jgi:hypothetical protein
MQLMRTGGRHSVISKNTDSEKKEAVSPSIEEFVEQSA